MESNNEQLRQIFIPLVAAEIIWDYVDKAHTYCAQNRVSETVKLTRAIKAMHQSYNEYVAKSLDRQHRDNVRAAADRFTAENAYHLTVMYCTLSNEMHKAHIGEEIKHEELRVISLCSMALLRALRIVPGVIALPKLKDLDEIMEAYVSPFEIDLTQNVEILQKVLARKLLEIEVKEP